MSRYKACKESAVAQAFYSRLATLSALQSLSAGSTGSSPLSPLSPFLFQQHFLARAASIAATSPTSPIFEANRETPAISPPGVDLSIKTIGLGSPPIRPFPVKRSATTSPKSSSGGSTPKKAKLSSNGQSLPRRKASRKLAFDEDKTSPVSGTIIRELAEGEEVPGIRKGKPFFRSLSSK